MNPKKRYLRFVSLRFRNYRVFQGVNEFRFNRHQTIIVGGSATGKTTIVEALANLGPKIGITAHLGLIRRRARSVVKTEGDRQLLHQYKDLIVLKSEDVMGVIEKYQRLSKVQDRARMNFQMILSRKPCKIKPHQDISPRFMAIGERQALYYAYIFAAREILELDVPVVIDDLYSCLDVELKQGLSDFLKNQSCQKILLANDHLRQEEHADYVLSLKSARPK
ncbi:MAG: AAA family ATPase [Candidatus Omnitrophota bacterium]